MELKDLDQNIKTWLALMTETNKAIASKATIQRFEPKEPSGKKPMEIYRIELTAS